MIEVLEGDNEALLDDLKSKEKIALENEALKKNINTLEDDNKSLLENIKAKEHALLEKEEALDQYLVHGSLCVLTVVWGKGESSCLLVFGHHKMILKHAQ